MTPLADATAIRTFLRRATRRVTLLLVMHGIATGLMIAVMISAIMWLRHGVFVPPPPESLLLALLGVVVGAIRGRMLRPQIAAVVESKAACQNLLITASELIDGVNRADTYVTGLIYRNGASLVESLRLGDLFPLRGGLMSTAIAAALWLVAATRHPATAVPASGHDSVATANAAITGIDVFVRAPSYTGRPATTLHDPARITALSGSTIQFTVHANGATVAIETLRGRQPLRRTDAGTFTGELVADADGYVALEPANTDAHVGPRRLIGLSVSPDEPPRVQITAPGHDLKFAEGHHAIDIAIETDDDIGLGALKLRYTRVSGSGERFTFTDGEVPLTITRSDKRHWKARVSWKLDSLALGPGDMVVYRAVAADDRPGATPTESDSYIAEVLAPGGVAASGFATDPEVERYALSEQMVILKTIQLQARKLGPDSLADAAADIASEQRRVRAEFVFMMGGEVGGADDPTGDLNEQAEASGEGDLAAARLLSQGRAALMGAIRLMSRADKLLTKPDVAAALTEERAALVQLEGAFAHSRIILRALTEREGLDLTRRLSGTLTDASGTSGAVAESATDPRTTSLRRLLADLGTLAASNSPDHDAGLQATRLAERVIRLDPGAAPLQRVAQQLTDAATATARHRDRDAHALYDQAATGLSTILRAELGNGPPREPTVGNARLAGALVDALRRASGPP